MSLGAVTRFYEKVASDSLMQKAFVKATTARIVSFAAENGHTFTERDLQTAVDQFNVRVQKLRDELKMLHDHPTEPVAGKTTVSADQFMSSLQSDRIYDRLTDVFDLISISQSG